MANATHLQNEPISPPDYARYDRVWQRVAPALDPYPQVRAAERNAVPAMAMQQPIPVTEQTLRSASENQPAAGQTAAASQSAQAEELRLPGAEENPCCMGTEAQSMTAVLEGFAREEAEDAAAFFQTARSAPGRGQTAALRALGRDAQRRGREVAAAWYLITGTPLSCAPAAVTLPRLPYRELLRRSYHDAACAGLNYARAADAAADVCLRRLLARWSAESYAAADRLLALLAQLS